MGALPRKRRTKDMMFEESLFNNMQDYFNLRDRLIALCCGRFELKNLPDYIYKPYIYKLLLEGNQKVIAYDEIIDRFFIYPFTSDGTLDEYGVPFRRRITLMNRGYTRVFTDKDSVILNTSFSSTPLLPIIEEYARKLYVISRTIDLNVNAQKTPVVVLCDEDQQLTFKNLMKQYEGNVPFIFGDKAVMNMDSVKVLNLNAPFVADKLQMLKSDVWNEFLTFIGVSNVSLNKKERLITDEVNRNMGGVLTSRNNFVLAVQDSFDQANKKFGTNWEFNFIEGDNSEIAAADEIDSTIEERTVIE